MFSYLLVGYTDNVQFIAELVAFHNSSLGIPFMQLSTISLAHRLLEGNHPSLTYGLGAGTMIVLYVVSLALCARRGGPLTVAQYALVVTLVPISSSYVMPRHLVLLAFPILVAAHVLMNRKQVPWVRWGIFAAVWLTWAFGFSYWRWTDEIRFGLKSMLGYVRLYSALGLWGLLASCIGFQWDEARGRT